MSDIIARIIKAHTGFDLYCDTILRSTAKDAPHYLQNWPTISEQQQYWKDHEEERMADPANGYVQWLEEKDKRDPFS